MPIFTITSVSAVGDGIFLGVAAFLFGCWLLWKAARGQVNTDGFVGPRTSRWWYAAAGLTLGLVGGGLAIFLWLASNAAHS